MRRIATLVAVILAATVVPAIVTPQAARALRPNAAVRVADINPGELGSGPYGLARFADGALFQADDGTNGTELWATDGTDAGTTMVKDIRVGSASSSPAYFTAFGDIALFVADDGTHGYELWKTDGTAAGTVRLTDINPGTADAFSPLLFDPQITPFGSIALFVAYNPDEGREFWRTDGTAAGTSIVDIRPGINSTQPTDVTVFGGMVLFSDQYTNELWRTDGTVAGSSQVKDINPDGASSPSEITPFGPIALFQAGASGSGRELWRTDGTDAGTLLVKDIHPSASSAPSNFTPFGNIALFSAETSLGEELWRTDGTEAGTVLVKDIATDNSSVPRDLTVLGGRVLFVANSPGDGFELWSTDGTEANTFQVKDITAPDCLDDSEPRDITAFGTVAVFSAYDCDHGRELWATNGTAAGTSMVADLNGAAESNPLNLLDIGTTLLFTADEGSGGQEIYRTVVRRVPGAPTIGTATAGNTQATVSFTPPASNGGSPITSYTVTSTPGGITKTGASSPLTVTGLTNGVAYKFTVHAINAVGSSPESAFSNAVTPTGTVTKSITVVQPNGGEHLARGAAYTIKWSYTGNPGTTVKIVLLKAGTAVQTIASSQAIGTGGAGQRSWTPGTGLAAASTYKIRITVNASSPVVQDASNNTFSLT